MKSRYRLLLVVWLLSQLLAGQQLALAHMIGHLGESLHGHSAQLHVAADDGDEERGAGHSLSHVCTTCVGCFGFDLAVAVELGFPPSAALPAAACTVAALPAPAFRALPPYLSRAPPSLRN